MKHDRMSGGFLPVIRQIFFGLLVLGLAGCQLFDDPLYEAPNARVAGAYANWVRITWDPVSGATDYIVRLNGGEAVVVTGTEYITPKLVIRGSVYTVSAVYGGPPQHEGPSSAPLVIRDLDPPLPLPVPADGEDKSAVITSYLRPPATPALTEWYDAVLSAQGVDYYIIPVDPAYTYTFWSDDSWGTSTGTRTLDIEVRPVWFGTNTPIGFGYWDSAYTTGYTISGNDANSTGYVLLRVESWVSGYTGTYGIAYTYQ
jgi:hypothetical protein